MGRKSGRSLNPADQYRKEQHKKEIKKNKQDRKKVREVNTALRDTTTEGQLAEYEELEKTGKIDKDGAKKLAELREKMSKIIDIKKAHGIKIRPKKAEPEKPVPVAEPTRDPTRSIYYDPVLNPYGAPPPGQPYLEYPPLPTDVPMGMEGVPGTSQQEQPQESDEGSNSDSEHSGSDSNSDSDSSSSGSESEDVDDEEYMPPLPEGAAPPKENQARHLEPTKPKLSNAPRIQQQLQHQQQWPLTQGNPGMYPLGMPRPGMQGPPGAPMNSYGPPMSVQPPYGNVYPPGRPGHGPPLMGYAVPPIHTGPGFGQPPLGFGPPGYNPPGPFGSTGGPGGPGNYGPPGYQAGPPHARPMRPLSQRPPPPRYVKPPRTSDPQSDPMTGHLPPDEKEKKRAAEQKDAATAVATVASASTHVSYSTPQPTSHPLPPKPATAQVPTKPVPAAGPVSISEEPQLRNLQKELVHLVPSTIMRKRVTQKGKIGKPVNAAPGVDEDDRSLSSSSPSQAYGAQSSSARQGSALAPSTSATMTTKEEGESEQEYRETGLGLRLPRINLAPSVPSIFGPRKIVVNSAPEVPVVVDKAAKKKAEYDEFLQSLEGDGLL
ncbi:hypothetical protein EDD21DRAFT_410325 [Dissophora ornata]|nr:hypothetical protein EDD21DRAFT_410325 [Dissophora ornata]